MRRKILKSETFVVTRTEMNLGESESLRYKEANENGRYVAHHPMIVTAGRLKVYDAVPGTQQIRVCGDVSEMEPPLGTRVFTSEENGTTYYCVSSRDRLVYKRRGEVLKNGEKCQVDKGSFVFIAEGSIKNKKEKIDRHNILNVKTKNVEFEAGKDGAILFILSL